MPYVRPRRDRDEAAERAVDEVLEALWTETEHGVARLENVAAVVHVEL